MKALSSYRDVARALKCSTRHIENLVKSDPNFPVIRLGRSVRFDLQDVLAYLKQQSRKRCEVAEHTAPSEQPSSPTRRSYHEPENLPF